MYINEFIFTSKVKLQSTKLEFFSFSNLILHMSLKCVIKFLNANYYSTNVHIENNMGMELIKTNLSTLAKRCL
jgi:hypothetical protein